jgi:hypothetical protein
VDCGCAHVSLDWWGTDLPANAGNLRDVGLKSDEGKPCPARDWRCRREKGEGLDVARTRIRDYLGWEEVQSQLKGQDVDLIRQATLSSNLETANKGVPEAVQQSYNIVVTVAEIRRSRRSS